jgi:nicotinamide N-methyltransferase
MGSLPVGLPSTHWDWDSCHSWNTARVASDTIHKLDISKGRRVLELGAGAGLPSLTAAVDGAEKVVITDYPDQSLVDNMIWNADVNLTPDVRERVDVEGFVWGAKTGSLLAKSGGKGYDVLILSDLVFNHSQVCNVAPTRPAKLMK